MTLRLRCIRCGDLDEMDPTDVYTLGVCAPCVHRMVASIGDGDTRGVDRFNRLHARYQRHITRHPTFKALTAALEALESVPHGTMAEPLPSEPS